MDLRLLGEAIDMNISDMIQIALVSIPEGEVDLWEISPPPIFAHF